MGGQGRQGEEPFNKHGWAVRPSNPATWITEDNIKNCNLNLEEQKTAYLNLRAGTDFLHLNPKEDMDTCVTVTTKLLKEKKLKIKRKGEKITCDS